MTVVAKRDEEQRPAFHFTPETGFMNDPNGLVYSKGIWHLYYQLDDRQLVAGHPEWGHATSKDLLHWTWHDKAITAPSDKSIFSGCCVVDSNNTSGLFDESIDPENRIVAIYTLHTNGHETQDIAISSDGGYTFTPYKNNPVLDIGWADFRDPKVLWHGESNQWVMVVAKCQEFKVGFYGSRDLIHWRHLSDFQGAGVRGYQYEVPNLMQVPFDDDSQRKKWVLFVSIAPGAPLGGSFTQYFVGEFDGTCFYSDDNYLRIADLGKDWYAAQTWFNTVDTDVYGIGWASNWQYGNCVPATRYRSAMSLPRRFTVREIPLNGTTKSLSLISRPVDLTKTRMLSNNMPEVISANGSTKKSSTTGCNEVVYKRHMHGGTGAFEFKLKIKSDSSKTPARVTTSVANHSGSSIQLNFVIDDQGMFICFDRGRIHTSSTWDHPLFDDKVNMWLPKTQSVYDAHIIVDAYVCEVFVNDGAYAFTNTFFLQDGVATSLTVSQDGVDTEVVDVYELSPIAH
jgi:beta-fructofuranosidase